MATRMQAREAVVQLLYARELGNDRTLEQASLFLYNSKIRNKQQEFALELLHGVCNNETVILQIMNTFLTSWNTERLGAIERNILKLGIYELLETKTQHAVVINESIELTKNFNVHEASALVNGVLDSISKKNVAELNNFFQAFVLEHINNATSKTHDASITVKQVASVLPKKSKNPSNKHIGKKLPIKKEINKKSKKNIRPKGKVYQINNVATQQTNKQNLSNTSDFKHKPHSNSDIEKPKMPNKE